MVFEIKRAGTEAENSATIIFGDVDDGMGEGESFEVLERGLEGGGVVILVGILNGKTKALHFAEVKTKTRGSEKEKREKEEQEEPGGEARKFEGW